MVTRSKTATRAIGASVHSGWALIVVAGGSLRQPVIENRRRIELVPGTDDRFTQPYHVAATLDIARARELVEEVARESKRFALNALRELATESLTSCAVVTAKAEKPIDLESTLRSHAMIHAAEGRLFRSAIADAATELGLHVYRIPENAVIATAAQAFHVTPVEVEKHLSALRRSVGPPWRRDEKLATLVALLALYK